MGNVIMIRLQFELYRFAFLVCLLFVPVMMNAQSSSITLQGIILEKAKNNTEIGVQGAKVWASKQTYTFTEKDGKFTLEMPDSIKKIVMIFSHIGTDTIAITDPTKEIRIVYPIFKQLKDVVIGQKKFSTEISLLNIQKIENISGKELLKAACCNLGESFETTPSVDVAFTDAVTGYRQIQLLGLAGPYTLITRENIPEVRGLASITGLTFTPGQWIEGMQLSKGTGSVVNGYEGLAGQINIELRKPMEGAQQFYNIYQSAQGRSEANTYLRFEPKERLYGNLFVHGKSQWLKMDQNKDQFIDQPIGNSIILSNRWIWFGKKGRELQLGAKYNNTNNWGGEINFNPSENTMNSTLWGMKLKTSRLDAWSKIGKVDERKPWKSMGLQLGYTNHRQDQEFGRKLYNADEQSLYANYIYQSIINNTNRVIKIGATVSYIDRNENVHTSNYVTNEIVSGIFSEYSHIFSKKVNAVLGARIDYHNLYGLYWTPRLHIRYAPTEQLAFRGSFGKAYRTATIFAENLGLFASNRSIVIQSSQTNGAYQLKNEEAINTGINATYKFKLNYQPGTFTVDYYYTYFLNQVLSDWEDPRAIVFYNSTKPTYAHSMQVQLDYAPIRKFDVRLAYRYHNVQATYRNVLMQKPLNAMHRAFINLSYQTRSKWSFDYTFQLTGKKRLPNTSSNPEVYQLPTYSPVFTTMNLHLNKAFKKGIEIYGGVENVLNYMQANAILDSEHPFGNYFDASIIWGPTMGRTIYAGLRYTKK